MREIPDTSAMLQASNLGIRFDRGDGNPLVITQSFNLAVFPGTLVCLSGRSGSGKTSILRTLAGIEVLTGNPEGTSRRVDGSVQWWGNDLASMTENQIREMRRSRMGFMDQAASMVHGLSAVENVLLPVLPDGRTAVRTKARRANDLLDFFGLKDRKDHRAERLSGGERQRVVLARALINEPKLILLDEPTASLDRIWADEVISCLEEFVSAGGAVVAASHDPHVSAVAHSTVTIETHRLVEAASLPETVETL